MIRQFIHVSAVAVVFALTMPVPAFADIAAFNAAVKAGDYKAAAAETTTIWPGFDKTSPDTAAVAREFGFANLVAGDYDAARDFGRFLKDKGASLPQPDDLKATSAVLLAMAEFRLKPDSGQREALERALQDRAKQPGVDNITILAADGLYHHDWAQQAWKKAQESTAVAADLFGRGQGQLKAKKDEALLVGATAEFMDQPIEKDYFRMIEVHDAIVDDIDAAAGNPSLRQSLIALKFQAQAWVAAEEAYFHSAREKVGSLTAKELPRRALKQPQTGLFKAQAQPDPRPLCEYTIDTSKFHYPQSKAFKKAVGSVVVRMDFDEKGAEQAVEVLAAVPAKEFADSVVAAAPSFRVVPALGQDTSKCRLDVKNFVETYAFFLG